MKYEEFKITDLGKFEDIFKQIVSSYQLDEKKEQVFEHLKQVLFDQIRDVDLAIILGKELNFDFATYSGLAYKLKKEIIDKKLELEVFKGSLTNKYWTKDNPNLIAQEIKAKLNLKFETEPHEHRFYQAVLSWIKGIRDNDELKDILIKAAKVGGLEMEDELAVQIIELLEQKKEEITKEQIDLAQIINENEGELEEKSGFTESQEKEIQIDIDNGPAKAKFEPQENITGDDLTIGKLLEVKGVKHADIAKPNQPSGDLVQEIEAKEEFLESREELAPPSPALVAPKGSMSAKDFNNFEFETEEQPVQIKTNHQDVEAKEAQILATIRGEEDLPEPQLPHEAQEIEPTTQPTVIKQEIPQVRSDIKQPSIIKQPEITGQRPTMDDVKFSPQLYGPIEELASFKITDLRRLSKDPNEAINKITAKLDLLEDESITKKVDGIKALKLSPLYKIYSEIMSKAITQGKSFTQIIEADPLMTIEEFKAIMTLNKQLQY